MPGSVDIVIPVLNEVATVDALIDRLHAACPFGTPIFVDNGSTDGTLDRLAQRSVRVVRHERNLGYGQSILDGVAAGTGSAVVMIDADLEYHPEDVPALLAALDRVHVVYGSRFLDRALQSASMPWARTIGNRLVSAAFSTLFGQRLSDVYTGIRAVRRDALARLELRTAGFDFVVELAAQAARAGLVIGEVPVRYTPRQLGTSKMHHLPELGRFASRTLRLWLRA